MARRRRDEMETFSGINVTPLMDLTFLLLIVFMITAPILEYTVDVSPPRMNAENISDEEAVLIGLDNGGKILIEGKPVTLPQLKERLQEIRGIRPGRTILIRADQDRPYREVVSLMRIVRSCDLHNVSLVTRAEE